APGPPPRRAPGALARRTASGSSCCQSIGRSFGGLAFLVILRLGGRAGGPFGSVRGLRRLRRRGARTLPLDPPLDVSLPATADRQRPGGNVVLDYSTRTGIGAV